MLWTSSLIKGFAVTTSDGRLGTVSDFLFDDATWLVRWLVVDTGSWLPGRKVLLPPSVLGHLDPANREFSVRLTRQQVKDSPDIDSDRPVSRQMETATYDYYGWSPYWGTGFYMGGYGYVPGGLGVGTVPISSSTEAMAQRADDVARQSDKDDWHLRSVAAVTGYHIHAGDGAIGHVEDFMVEDADWSIHYLVVDTRNWLPGKKVLISPRSVQDIDWTERQIDLDVNRQQVKNSPAYDLATMVDRTYERDFHNYYDNVGS